MATWMVTMADNVKITVEAPSVVETGDQFRVRFTVNSQDVSNFSAPDFKGFEVIYGPATSRQSSFQFINGKSSRSSSITYTYVLVASKVGTYTIDAASAQVDGVTIHSRSLKVKVTNIGSGAGTSSQRQYSSSSQPSRRNQSSSTKSISSEQLFMTATASRTTVYEQEAILLTYKLYTLVNLTQLDGKLPTLDGFQIQEIPLPHNKEFHTEQYKGRTYHAVTWTQYVLFPQKSGRLTIPAVTFEGTVVQPNQSLDPIDMFFNGTSGMIETKKKISAPAVEINVKSLPTPPAGFSGAVGQFSVTSSLSSQSVRAGDALTLKVNVKGVGNMKLINTPGTPFPKDFESYDPKVNDQFSLTHKGLSGVRTFEYLAVPHRTGKYTIPSTPFIYFDPVAASYKTVNTPSYTLTVAKGNGKKQDVNDYSGGQDEVKELGQDIRFIHTSDVNKLNKQVHLSWYLLFYLIPLCLFFFILIMGRKRIQSHADVASMRNRKATKIARHRLKRASALLAAHNHDKFYEEVLQALYGYAADKYNLSQEHLNKDNLQQMLQQRGVDATLIEDFLHTISDCEYARYAGGDNQTSNMENLYSKAVSLITNIESQLK